MVGFEGDKCQDDIDECDANPCINGGTCHNIKGSYECFCPPGYTGQRCHSYTGDLSQNAQQALRAMGADKKTNIIIVSDHGNGELSTNQWIIICIIAAFLVVVTIIAGGVFTYIRCVRNINSRYSAGKPSNRHADMALPVPGSNDQRSTLTIVRTSKKLSSKNATKVPGKVGKKLPPVSSAYSVDMSKISSNEHVFSSSNTIDEVSQKRPKSTASASYLSRVSSQCSNKKVENRRFRSHSDCEDKVHSVARQQVRKSADFDRRSIPAETPLLNSVCPSAYLPTYEEACEENDSLLGQINSPRQVSSKNVIHL